MAIFDDFITLKEAGQISGYHPDYIGALIRSNKVKGKKVGKNWFVSKKEVQEHFTTQHFAPAQKVFFGDAKVLFFWLALVMVFCLVAGAFGMYEMYNGVLTQGIPDSMPVNTNLSDTVDPAAGLDNNPSNIAQPVPLESDVKQ